MSSRRLVALVVAALSTAAVVPASALPGPAAAAAVGPVQVVARVPATGLTEVAWEGDTLYVGELNGETGRDQTPGKGGVRILDLTDAEGRPSVTQVGMLACRGSDNDVVVVRPGLVMLAHHRSSCHAGYSASGATNNGVTLADVSDPARPVKLGSVSVPSAHTLTPLPGTDYVYVHPGGLTNGGGRTSIVDVSDPRRPRVAASFKPNETGCHDLQFARQGGRSLAFCAGLGEVQTWDVSDPLAPVVIGRIVNPAMQFPHNAVPSPDGRLLVVNDEAFAAHECATGTSIEGSLWVYDIADPTRPLLAGRVAPPASPALVNAAGGTTSWCTAHNYGFLPGTRTLVASWFTGGTTVEDLTDPLAPVRLAAYQPADADAYSAHWYRGRIYVADMRRGLEVLEVPGLAEGQAAPPPPGRAVTRDRTAELVPASFVPSVRPRRLEDVVAGALCTVPTRGA